MRIAITGAIFCICFFMPQQIAAAKLTINISNQEKPGVSYLLALFIISSCGGGGGSTSEPDQPDPDPTPNSSVPSCSDYFIECLNEYGFFKGIFFGFKRIIKCHPIKFLGGSSGTCL